jgi:hypothetical protein
MLNCFFDIHVLGTERAKQFSVANPGYNAVLDASRESPLTMPPPHIPCTDFDCIWRRALCNNFKILSWVTLRPRARGNKYLKRRNLISSQTDCELFSHIKGKGWAGWLSRYSDWLQTGRSGIESRWGRDFPPDQTGPVAHAASCKMGTVSFPWVEVAGAWVWPPNSILIAEVLERVELYLYSP